ncbi:PRC-barrel domain-containing protein [Acuticoccus sp. MNP-M23]|uniref:PRC-barrel domain-containing protein n=1 Tax=Acuticoccus sp. MNP-M23 TaxID=3072793 RepID=UPI002815F420|nr:PRC-barrel domain-containing protein [Acuticoccus sp. MNP-M23]WMS43335.1 PRC-barrel domain-containing protein [Acuticoccus sp. MNP-M23]
MNATRTLMIGALMTSLAAPALAQTNVEVVAPDGVDVVAPEGVEVVSPAETVDVDAGDVGEAPVVNAEGLVELDSEFVLPTLNVPIYALDDYDLVDRNGEDLGEVEEVLGPNENTATAVAIEFDGPGWFLTDDDVTRVVDINLLSIEGDNLILDITEDNVRSLPVYQD